MLSSDAPSRLVSQRLMKFLVSFVLFKVNPYLHLASFL